MRGFDAWTARFTEYVGAEQEEHGLNDDATLRIMRGEDHAVARAFDRRAE